MNRDEAIELLLRGPEGVRKWNAWRLKDEELPDLEDADLSCASLADANLSGTSLVDANLSHASLIGADLSRADLSGASLCSAFGGFDTVGRMRDMSPRRMANFKSHDQLLDANHESADLSDANLERADLDGSVWDGANLSRANLEDADLSRCGLRDANLFNTNLSGATFIDSNLSGADLTGAVTARTKFVNVALSDVTGLEKVNHRGPSSIGIDTMVLSGGKIPEAFLRGCGVPDSFIAYQRSLVANPIEFFSCFISYSHTDKPFARRLHDGLQGRGIRCWLDEKALKPGDDIYHEVDHGIRLWDKVLLCASKTSLASWWVKREVETAIEKEQKLHHDRGEQVLSIIPLNLDGSLFGWEGSHAATLRKRLAADFTDWQSDNAKFEASFEAVVDALRSDAAAKPDPPEPKI